MSKAVAEADAAAVQERKECVEGVRWVDGLCNWFEKNRAPMFDVLRKLDAGGNGVISTTVFAAGLRQIRAPLNPGDVDRLTEALDFEGKDKIDYCRKPQLLRCYGGGLHELVQRGVERVMMNHRQDLQEIEDLHAERVAKITAVPAPAAEGGAGEGEVEGGDAAADDGDGDGDNADDGDDGDPRAEDAGVDDAGNDDDDAGGGSDDDDNGGDGDEGGGDEDDGGGGDDDDDDDAD